MDNLEHNRRLNILMRVQVLRAEGHTIEEACEQAGISRSTHHRWLKDGTIQQDLAEWLREIQAATMAYLLEHWGEIFHNVVDMARGISHDPTVKVYPRDMIAAFDRLVPFIEKMESMMPADYSEEKAYLESQGIGWMPIQRSGKIDLEGSNN